MTSRQARRERRAAERKDKKREIANAASQQLLSPAPDLDPADSFVALNPQPVVSEARLAANRANAAHSTGPKTPEGKSISSRNAVTTGLNGRTILLPGEDENVYYAHVAALNRELKPVGSVECALAQSIADTMWRLDRIPSLEAALFALGHAQFAAQFESAEPARRPALIEGQIVFAFERQLRNLHLQESRLRRQRENDLAELRASQHARSRAERQSLEDAAKLYLTAQKDRKPFDPAAIGFDFSLEDVQAFLEGVRASRTPLSPPLDAPALQAGRQRTLSSRSAA